MKICSLTIYHYGMHSSLTLNVSEQLQVIFGQNEAGKSTIMAFIKAMLFGFPNRFQKEYMYVATDGLTCGGNIVLEIKGQTYTIERVLQRREEEVAVYRDNEKIGGKEAVSKLLKGLDETAFQAIFAFDIHGLQGLEKVKATDLDTFLFSTSTLGSNQLQQLEKLTNQRLDDLFKPNGKRPILNEQLEQIEQKHQQLLNWKEKLAEYELLVEQEQQTDDEILALEEKKKYLNEQRRQLEIKKSITPYLVEEQQIELQLNELPPYDPFPVDGLERFDKLKHELLPLQGRYDALKEKEKYAVNDIVALDVNDELIAHKDNVDRALEGYPLYEKQKLEEEQIADSIASEQKQLTEILHELDLDTHDLEHITLNYNMRETIGNLYEEQLELEKRLDYIEQEFEKTKSVIAEQQSKIQHYKQDLLTEEQRQKLREELQEIRAYHNAITEEKEIKETYSNVEKALKAKELKQQRFQRNVGVLSAVAIIVAALCAMFMQMREIAVAIFIAVILFDIVIFIFMKQLYIQYIDEQKERLAFLTTKLDQLNKAKVNDGKLDEETIRNRLIEDEHNQQFLKNEQFLYQQKKEVLKKLYDERLDLLQQQETLHETIATFCRTHKLPTSTDAKQVLMYMQLLRDVLDRYSNITNELQKQSRLEKQIKQYEKETLELLAIFGIRAVSVTPQALEKLRTICAAEIEKKQRKEKLIEELTENEETLAILEKQMKTVKDEMETLFSIADVADEEQFRTKGKAHQLAKTLIEKRNSIQKQLETIVPKTDAHLIREVKEENINYMEELETIYDNLAKIEEKLTYFRDTKSQLRMSITMLEEDKNYSTLLHEFELQKSEFQYYAKKWAVYQLAKHLLQKTKEYYRNVRFPKIIEGASRYFSILTNNKYVNILFDENENIFFVKRHDGKFFRANELSQGTKEQLYVSLRFSLAMSYPLQMNVPIIIDDSFVNFDKKRLDDTMTLLKEICRQRQVLFFTCHEHQTRYFANEEVIMLERGI